MRAAVLMFARTTYEAAPPGTTSSIPNALHALIERGATQYVVPSTAFALPTPWKESAVLLTELPLSKIMSPSAVLLRQITDQFISPVEVAVPTSVIRNCMQVFAAAPPVRVTVVFERALSVFAIDPTLTLSIDATFPTQSVVVPNAVLS